MWIVCCACYRLDILWYFYIIDVNFNIYIRDNINVLSCVYSKLIYKIYNVYSFLDTIYTERYMGLLGENNANYKNASLLTHAEKIRNKKYMLMHGTYDDNVHYQQSMMLSFELERRVILFRQQVRKNVLLLRL